MKRIFKSLIIFILVLTFAVGMLSCKQESNKPKTVKAERSVMLADYESFDDMYDTTNDTTGYSYEGYYNITNDKSKVISGNGSLEVYIKKFISESWAGYAEDTGLAATTCYNVFSTVKNGGKWGFEWKYLSWLGVDVYNANEFDVRVSMFTLTRDGFPFNFATATLSGGQKKTVFTNVNRYFMQNEFNDKISHIVLMVNYDKTVNENGELYYPEASVYFDNLSIKVNENSVIDDDGGFVVNKSFESESEILNFNDIGDLSFMRETGNNYVKEADNQWLTKSIYVGTGSAFYYNNNEKYVHSGNVGSLEWRITPTLDKKYTRESYRYCTEYSYAYKERLTGITVCSEYLNYYNFSQLKNGKARISVDVFNAASYDKDVFFGIHDNTGVAEEIKTESPYMYGATDMTDKCYRLKAGEWTTLYLTDFSQLDLNAGLARLRLMTSLSDVDEEISIYVNNLKIEYEGKADVQNAGYKLQTADYADTVAPKICTSFNYKIVLKGEKTQLPQVTFSETVNAVYELDGKKVSANEEFTPTEIGDKLFKITATDSAGNKSVKEVVFTVTDNVADLNKVYALDERSGLIYHAGKSGMGLNELRLKLISDDDERPCDFFGNEIPEIIDGNVTVSSCVAIDNYTTYGRISLTNALCVNPQEKYSQLYFWFYNGGEGDITLNFNNYEITVKPSNQWQKIVIAPKTVEVGGVESTVTDYSLISSLGKSTLLNEVIDLEDMVGTFLRITYTLPYEKAFISSIYGVPNN